MRWRTPAEPAKAAPSRRARPAPPATAAESASSASASAAAGEFQVAPAGQLGGEVGDHPAGVAASAAAADHGAASRRAPAPSPPRRPPAPPAAPRAAAGGSPRPPRPPRRSPGPPAPPIMICSCRSSTRAHRLHASRELLVLLGHAARPPADGSRAGRWPRGASSRPIAGEQCALETVPDQRGDRADLRGGRGGVVPEPARRRAAGAEQPLVDGREADGGRRRRARTRSSSAAGVARRHVQRDRVRHGDGHSARARPCGRQQRAVEAQPRVGHRRDGVAEPGSSPASARPAARWLSRKVSTAACSAAADVGGVAQAGADLLGVAGRATQRVRQRGTPRRRASRWTCAAVWRCEAAPAPASSTGSAAGQATTRSGVHSVHRRCPQAVDNASVCLRCPPCDSDRDDAERGSTLPFVLVCWTVAALMAFGAIAASDAFLEQQEVQSVCDGAALAAANRTDEAVVYTDGVGTAAAAHPGDRAGGGRRPARRRRHAAGRLVRGDRRRRGDRPLHALRRHRLRLAVPRRRAARAHGDRQRPGTDAPADAQTAPDLERSGAVVPRRGG